MNKKEILAFENITFKRDGREILKGVNWEIKEDEKWVLLGLNGSGKSTLLGMIPVFTHPTSGILRVFEKTFGKYPWEKVKSRVGFVSSTMNSFLNTLNYYKLEEIIISGKYSTIGIYNDLEEEDYIIARQLMKDFNLEYLKDGTFLNQSQGEQRRTLIARAFMNNPDLMILDEPCASLDLKSREHLLKILNEKYENIDKPLVYVTHSIEEIFPAITHVAIMKEGEIICKGNKKDIIREDILSQIYDNDIKISWKNNRPWITINWK
ncbi:ABC transporter ATP-binding protein [Miniphocaeibacter massiliensis]|uniref:ABC transporter ATP-binding protein n=1 Tax=Miniphocaeibacter massiliensis TaxID=2041841 RepID=UPI000C1C4E2B|nr:ATP-binding cassette domain-containing protein [Miniphocaeibacter massiliensis]